jgi:hypothetical protein
MQLRIMLPAVASLCLAASAAFAQATPPPAAPDKPGMMQMHHFDKAEMAKHIGQMCENRYAKAVGHLAELETRLNLTAVQKPLFNRWRDSVLSAAKTRVADCQNFKMPDQPLSIVDHAKMHEKMLQAQLDILKAQMPALEALNASLSQDQQKIFQHAAMRMMMERHEGMMGRGMHGMHGMWMMRHHDGGDMPPPPPAD